MDNYEIVQSLGKGALGETFLAQRTFIEQGQQITKQFTIKTIDLTKLAQIGIDANVLQQEIKDLIEISKKPDCARYMSCYYDSFVTQQLLYVVTDYIVGKSLQEILLAQVGQPAVNYNVLLDQMAELGQSVEYIHRHGIAHQNIKPSNIIQDTRDNRLKLIDFAFSCSNALNAQCKGKPGTVYYMPPELLAAKEDPSQRPFAYRTAHDIWSTGVVFYQMANIGKNYIDFTSNDPEQIAQQIQHFPVKASENEYPPINSIIAVLLTKDPRERPTAGQLRILIQRARPGCLVDGQMYDRVRAEGILTALGIQITSDIDDHTLCQMLTEHLATCKLKNQEYTREALVKLAEILGIETAGLPHTKLCKTIQDELETKNVQYTRRVTEELLRAIDYTANAVVRGQRELTSELAKRIQDVYNEAKRLQLIDMNILEGRRQEKHLQYLVYRDSASVEYAKIYALQQNTIIELMLSLNPQIEIGGKPLSEYKI